MKKKSASPTKLFRSFEASEVNLDKENRTLEFAFSSDAPVDRWFGREILSHEPGACDFSRLNDGAPLLFNHDTDKHIGTIEKGWLGEDKRGWVRIRFGNSELAQEKMADVSDKILRKVSFGYMVDDMVLSRKGAENEPSEYTVTKFTPYEVSFVTVPADNGVGLGRDLEGDEEFKRTLEAANSDFEKRNEKPAGEIPALEGENMKFRKHMLMDRAGEANGGGGVDLASVRAEAMKAERERSAGIQALGEKFKQPELARQLIEGGKSLDEARAAFLEKMGNVKPLTGNEGLIGMSDKEVRQFSFMRAINAMMDPANKRAQEAAGFEREVSLAAAKIAGKEARGFMVPFDVLAARDLNVGTATAGGHTVATVLKADSFIDLLRKKSVMQRAGATVLNGLVGNIAIPRQTAGATAYWIGEGSAPTESQQAFDQVAMTPKTLGAFTDYTRKLLLQSSIAVEQMVRADLAKVIALECDRAALYGSGSSNQPAGVTTLAINTVDLAAAAPTFAEIVAMETEIAADNADVEAMKYIVNAVGRGALKTTQKGTNLGFIWEQGNTVNGYAAEVSNQVASGDFLFGNWADVLLGFWSGLDLFIDPYTGATAGTVRVIAHQDCDVAVRHVESFCRANASIA